MTWVIWRQHRQQAIVALAGLGAFVAFFALTGPAMSHTYHASGLAACIAARSDCGSLLNAFDAKYNAFQVIVPLFLVLPALVGVFWGAPLIARELERGTFRLAWTQSVSRRHWAIAKLTSIGGAVLALGAAFAALVTWWSLVLTITHTDRFVPGIFDLRGLAPIGYMLFAIALGIFLGHLIGKVLPAMGATLAGFTAVRFVITVFVRKHYMPAKTSVATMGVPKFNDGPRGAWVLSRAVLDRAGHIISHEGGIDFQYLSSRCPNIPSPKSAFAVPVGGKDPIISCVTRLGLRSLTTFQPANRYWTFQWIEFAIYAVLAFGLLGFVVWRVSRSPR